MDITKTISARSSLRSATMSPMDDAFVASRREEKWLSTLTPLLSSTEQQLWSLWEQHDFDEELRERRKRKSEELISNLLADMVRQEKVMGEKLTNQIRSLRHKVNDLRAQLGLAPFNECAYPPESVRLWRLLESESATVSKQVEDMEGRLPELERRVDGLRERLGEEKKEREGKRKREESEDKENALASLISNPLLPLMEESGGSSEDERRSPEEKMVLHKRVARLEGRCMRLSRELEDRKERIRVAQFEMKERTERIGDPDLSSSIADLLSFNLEGEGSVIKSEIVERAERMREVVAFRYREWSEREAFAYDELILQLHELWEACHVPERERSLPKRFLPEKHSHLEVERARSEVGRLERVREEMGEVNGAIERWIKLWMEKVHFEQESEQRTESGVSKYANRAGTLLKAMKRANQLDKVLLPSALIAVQSAVEKYEERRKEQGGGERCLVHGMSPLEYIEHVKQEHAREREERRAERVAARKAGLAGGAASCTNLTKSPWMPGGVGGGRSVSRLASTAFSTSRMPTTPYTGAGPSSSSSRMTPLSRVAASSTTLLQIQRSPLTMRTPLTPSNLAHTPSSRSKFATPALPSSHHHTHHTPNTSVLSGRVRKSMGGKKGKRISAKGFFTPILSALSPISAHHRPHHTAALPPPPSPMMGSSMTSSSGVSSRPSTAASSRGPAPSSRLPAPKTPLTSSLGSLARTPRFQL